MSKEVKNHNPDICIYVYADTCGYIVISEKYGSDDRVINLDFDEALSVYRSLGTILSEKLKLGD